MSKQSNIEWLVGKQQESKAVVIGQGVKTVDWKAKLAVSCYICEKGIPVYDINIKAPLFCEDCRNRLKEVLYGSAGESEE